jgi:hypothetical protein
MSSKGIGRPDKSAASLTGDLVDDEELVDMDINRSTRHVIFVMSDG